MVRLTQHHDSGKERSRTLFSQRFTKPILMLVSTVAVMVSFLASPASAFVVSPALHTGLPGRRCLDANLAGGSNGTKVQLWDCGDGSSQQWR